MNISEIIRDEITRSTGEVREAIEELVVDSLDSDTVALSRLTDVAADVAANYGSEAGHDAGYDAGREAGYDAGQESGRQAAIDFLYEEAVNDRIAEVDEGLTHLSDRLGAIDATLDHLTERLDAIEDALTKPALTKPDTENTETQEDSK